MEQYGIVFVILHYKTYNETLQCINSLIKLDGFKNMAIVMVDNSYIMHDESGRKLQKEFSKYNNFYYIPNEKNTFFSYGNNLGYSYARQLNPEFVVVTNSDTVFRQHDLKTRLDKLKSDRQLDLIGPDIVRSDVWEHQNPYALEGLSIERANEDIRCYEGPIEELMAGKRVESIITKKIPLILRKFKRYLDSIRGGITFGSHVRTAFCLERV